MTNETAVFLMLAYNIRHSRIGFRAGLLYGKEHHRLWADYLAQQAGPLIERFYGRICVQLKKVSVRYWGEKHPHHSDCFDFIARFIPQPAISTWSEIRGTLPAPLPI